MNDVYGLQCTRLEFFASGPPNRVLQTVKGYYLFSCMDLRIWVVLFFILRCKNARFIILFGRPYEVEPAIMFCKCIFFIMAAHT